MEFRGLLPRSAMNVFYIEQRRKCRR